MTKTPEQRLEEIAREAERAVNWLCAGLALAAFLLGVLVGLRVCGL